MWFNYALTLLASCVKDFPTESKLRTEIQDAWRSGVAWVSCRLPNCFPDQAICLAPIVLFGAALAEWVAPHLVGRVGDLVAGRHTAWLAGGHLWLACLLCRPGELPRRLAAQLPSWSPVRMAGRSEKHSNSKST